jgi:molecular chaperone DnaK
MLLQQQVEDAERALPVSFVGLRARRTGSPRRRLKGWNAPRKPSFPLRVPTFDIDANGIVNVTARDKATGKEQQIRIQASGGLSEADIQRMVREAEQHAEEDRRRRELVEARNVADTTIYTAEKQLEEHGGRVSDGERRPVEEAIAALREAVAGEDAAVIRQRLEALSQAMTRLGEGIHRAAAAGDQAATGGEDVMDAEF